MAKVTETPNGTKCIAVESDSRFAYILRSEIRGGFQDAFIKSLIENGYNQPTINIKGSGIKYRGRYETSIANLVTRINMALDKTSAPYRINAGRIGTKGGFGYYIE